MGLFSPRSRLGQDPHFVPSWGKPRVGEEEKALAHPSQELCPGLVTTRLQLAVSSHSNRVPTSDPFPGSFRIL